MQRYELLHYPGDVTGSDGAQPGTVLGHDEAGRFYEVLDASFERCSTCSGEGTVVAPNRGGDPLTAAVVTCGQCRGRRGWTTVQLQYASPANIRAAMVKAGVVPA
jgi:hypothetical protein